MNTLSKSIIRRIKRWKRGKIFFANDFSDLGTSGSIRMVLHRLHEAGQIQRITNGIYLYPEYLPDYLGGGIAFPGLDNIAIAISRRDNLRVAPNMASAQNILGLSTQVPTKVVYWTDGSSRTIKIPNGGYVVFRHSDKMLHFAFKSRIMQLISIALQEVQTTTDEENRIIKSHLNKVSEKDFAQDIKLVNDHIKDYLLKLKNG